MTTFIVKRNRFLKKIIPLIIVITLLTLVLSLPAFASGLTNFVNSTWGSVKTDLVTIINQVVFPILWLILAILLVAFVSTAIIHYKQQRQIDYTSIALTIFGIAFSIAARFTWESLLSN